MMEYKGYHATIVFDDDANAFHGEALGLRDVVTFAGHSADELRQAFHDSVDDYIEFCTEAGREPDKPYSGKFVVRITPELHRKLDIVAATSGTSINSIVNHAIEETVEKIET